MNAEVSIIVPVFNGAATIANTVEHLLAQSLPPKEIIVVDDGSTDNTADALKPFENQIRY
ncbi:MAG: glycosyltransferase, partial [Acidobacteria bacterium]|nr:glycosyltransferase [Acidobacteriota bacterium]